MSLSTTPRWDTVQHLYTVDANKPPPDNYLLVGEIAVELADPVKLWVGVPTSMVASGKKLLYDNASLTDLVHSFNTRQGDVLLTLADVTGAGGAPILNPTFQGSVTLPGNATQPLCAVPLQQLQAAIAAIPPYAVTISDTPPASPYNGMLWFDSVNASLTIRYQDPDSTQWVIANIGGGAGGAGGAGGVTSWNSRIGDVTLNNADVIAVLPGSNIAPSMNGPVAIGTSTRWALADHVHPTDTSLYPASNPSGFLNTTTADPRYVNTPGDTMTGALTLTYTSPSVFLNKTAGTTSNWVTIVGNTNGVIRWQIQPGTAETETGGNAGSNFGIFRYDDAGSYLGNPLSINRASGNINIQQSLVVSGALNANAGVIVTGGLNASGVISAVGAVNGGPVGGNYCQIASGGGNAGLVSFYSGATRMGYVGFSDGSNMHVNSDGLTMLLEAPVISASGTVLAINGRVISRNTNNNPGFAAYNPAVGAKGFITDNSGHLLFCNFDGSGNYGGATYAYFHNTNGFFYSNYGMIISAYVTCNDVYFSSDNNACFKSGVVSGRILQFNPNYYLDYNWTNGTLSYWMTQTYWIMRNDWVVYNAVSTVGGIGAYQNYSDMRGKRDVAPAEVGLPEVLRLNPIRFRRLRNLDKFNRDHPPPPDDLEIGFSAQQVRDVIPEAVMKIGIELPDGTGGIDDDEPTLSLGLDPIVAALVNAVKELATTNTALASRVTAIERLIT